MYIKFVLPNDTPSLDGITTCPLQCRYEQKDFTNNLDCVTQNVLEAHFLIGPPTASGGVAVDPLVDVCLILMDWKDCRLLARSFGLQLLHLQSRVPILGASGFGGSCASQAGLKPAGLSEYGK